MTPIKRPSYSTFCFQQQQFATKTTEKQMSRRMITPVARIQSGASTRASSRGPISEEGELLNDITFGNLDELISDRLNTLLNLDSTDGGSNKKEENKGTVKLKLNSIPEIIKTLQKSRNEVSSNDRELLLNQLYHLTAKNADLENDYDDYQYETDLLTLLKVFQSSKTQNETILSVRSLTSFIIANIENAGVVYSEDKALNILSILEKKITDTTISNIAKQYLIYSYSSIALVIYDESGGYGVDGIVEFLNEFLLGLVDDSSENGQIIASVIYGLGSLLTILIGSANLNEVVETVVETAAGLLTSTDALEIVKPSSMLIGLCYEIYQYDDTPDDDLDDFDEDDDILPYSNTYEIKSRLEELAKISSKKVSKKDKKEGRSLFKDVLTTVNFYSDKRNRINKILSIKDDETQIIEEEELVLSHIKLSKSRSLAVKSWFSFFRLIQLKWVFGNGIHTQLANNSQISNIVRDKPATDYASQFAGGANDGDEEYWNDEKTKKLTNKKKAKDLENKRQAKLHVSLDQAGVLQPAEERV